MVEKIDPFDEEIPLRFTNIELSKIVKEQAARNKKMEAEIEKLKNAQPSKVHDEDSDSEFDSEEEQDDRNGGKGKLSKE